MTGFLTRTRPNWDGLAIGSAHQSIRGFIYICTIVQGEPVNQTSELPKAENDQTVPDVPSTELVVKHPLENKWTLWFYENRSKVWEDNVREVASFDTVEDFWW